MQVESPIVQLNTLPAGATFVIAGDAVNTVFIKTDRPVDSQFVCVRLATGVVENRGGDEGVVEIEYRATRV